MLMFLLIQLGRQYKQEMDVKTILKQVGEQDPARVYKIELANRNIKEITALKLLDKVRCLVLNFNLIERIQNLQFFQDLRQLHLEYNAIQKIQALQSNKNLQVLTFSNNRIEKIQNIAHLIRLETLVLDCNKINKLTGLEYLKELKHLSARNNAISAVQNLPSFSKLITLNLAHNKINNISATFFGSSKTLSFLDLSHNKIENTSFLQPLVALQNLNLSSNNIEELKISPLPNLQSLNLSKNRLQKIPNIVLNFPQLMSLNISFNMICSEHDLLVALGEIELLTQIDFRQNPMHTQTFENALQKIHRFDFLNGKIMTKAGAKYYQQVDKIKQQLDQNSILYGQDDEKDRQIKMSGFYDDELEFRMSGMKVNRPQSPAKKKKNLEKATFYDDIDRVYNQFVSGDQRIKIIREQYLKICGNYNISSQHIITEPPLESQHIHRVHSMQQKTKEQIQSELSQQYITNEKEIYKQTQKNLNKWKELKQREKSFNIRDVIKKSRGKDSSINKGATATSGWGATGLKPEKMKSQLLRTQALPKKGQQIFKTVLRPSSMRKKQ